MGYKDEMDVKYHLTSHWQPLKDEFAIHPKFASKASASPTKRKILWLLPDCELNIEDPLASLVSPLLEFVKRLQTFYPVDIRFEKACHWHESNSTSILSNHEDANDYRYFLAVEEIICSQFITQRIDLDGIPLIFTSDPSTYQDLIPKWKPIINIAEFKKGPQELANYLKKLDTIRSHFPAAETSGYFQPPISFKERLCMACQISDSVPDSLEVPRKSKQELEQMWHSTDCKHQESLWKYIIE